MRVAVLMVAAVAACNEGKHTQDRTSLDPAAIAAAEAALAKSMQDSVDRLAESAVMPEITPTITTQKGGTVPVVAGEVGNGGNRVNAANQDCDELLWLAASADPTLMPLFDNGELQRVAARPAGVSINGKIQIVPLPGDAEGWDKITFGDQSVPRIAGVELGSKQVALAAAYLTKQSQKRLALVRWRDGKPAILGTVAFEAAQLPQGLAVANEQGAASIYSLGDAGLVAQKSPSTLAALCAAAPKEATFVQQLPE